MKVKIFVPTLFAGFILVSCDQPQSTSVPQASVPNQSATNKTPPKEWEAWAMWADEKHSTGDGQGHGPDVGSDEWAYALGTQLGISDSQGHGPDIKSDEWRRAVENKLQR
ncbi:hypothetical protein OAE72_01655 [Akkermansiaceae bacterium]|jgi:hypothetical protein|nr:hypothetical protein [Akkermansiaceae bacterium]MDB4422805.1 hypothetical protein [bacterium]MDB4680639.1 hypothetical protein [Akkermansiaceae bacterium]MDF1711751.1 hypothetical protein [Akkermansiaceae bacterium]